MGGDVRVGLGEEQGEEKTVWRTYRTSTDEEGRRGVPNRGSGSKKERKERCPGVATQAKRCPETFV